MEFVAHLPLKKKPGVSSVVCPAISSDAACTAIVEANSKQARIPGSQRPSPFSSSEVHFSRLRSCPSSLWI